MGVPARRSPSGKLKAAAEYWAGGGDQSSDKTQLREDAKALGVILPPDPDEPEDEHFIVWEENWPIVEMFLRLDWRFTMGERIGLNYQTLEWLCGVFKVEDIPEMFDGLQIMENAALGVIAKKQDG